MKEKKSRQIYEKRTEVRLTEKELSKLHEKAEKAKLSISRLLVKSALSDDKVLTAEEKDEIKQLRFEIRKIGINLNQIAHYINASQRGAGNPAPDNQINEIQKLIEQALRKLLKKL